MESGLWCVDLADNSGAWAAVSHIDFCAGKSFGMYDRYDISDQPYKAYQSKLKFDEDMKFAMKNPEIVKKDLGLSEGEREEVRDKVKREL